MATLLSACATAGRAVTPTEGDRFYVAAYHPWWAGDSWTDSPLEALDELFYFELEVAGDGRWLDPHGWPSEWSAMTEAALAAGVPVTPTLSMHDPEAFETLLSDPSAIDTLVAGAIGLLQAHEGLSGLHIDFEVFQPVSRQARSGFGDFLHRLKGRIDREHPGRTLSAFVLAFDMDDAYDEAVVAEAVDYLVLQGYDFHSAESERAGPVAPVRGPGTLHWGAVVDRFVELGVPRRKIVMSVPLYGYQWPVADDRPGAATRGPGLAIPLTARPEVLPELPRAIPSAEEHGVRRDRESGSPFYAFRAEDGWYQGWFEDVESLGAKYRFVRERGLGGVALFPGAYATEEIWRETTSAFRAPRTGR